jgi:hypothetical protein
MTTVRIRDVQTRKHLNVPGETPMLRVPWEAENVRGPTVVEHGLASYDNKMGAQIARTRAGHLHECKPGDVVLVQYEASTAIDPRVWWTVEVEAIDGDDSDECE